MARPSINAGSGILSQLAANVESTNKNRLLGIASVNQYLQNTANSIKDFQTTLINEKEFKERQKQFNEQTNLSKKNQELAEKNQALNEKRQDFEEVKFKDYTLPGLELQKTQVKASNANTYANAALTNFQRKQAIKEMDFLEKMQMPLKNDEEENNIRVATLPMSRQ
ncbi:hypothetical protein FMM55_00645 [Campylobacter sp. LR196d]|uniref:hypothetical protein n=1 Tax=Campylobacter sp. LR196d TaxID=2593543 RepID=UPI00123C6641|nr:hypothetical protein [Campylobacter sp. LR196d]KAA6228829.1 hypothetical protein FMM55_00645 [Campylobacter sp. LR196d]